MALTPKPLSILAEQQGGYHFLTERHLQAMWFEQKYFRQLITISGDPIQVISPGIWNAEAGPDFKKAHLKIGDQELHGDVEIHLQDESWYHHNHHIDERYENVVLHLSLWKSKTPKTLLTLKQRPLISTHLEEKLTIPLARIVQLIDLDLYPYKKFVGSGRCAQTLFKDLPADDATAFFRDAAINRLERKKKFLEANCEVANQQIAIGIAMALGYKQNAQAFLSLYHFLQSQSHLKDALFVVGLKAVGFFNAPYSQKWKASEHYQKLLSEAEQLPEMTFQQRLILAQIRPFNHPARRLAYLIKLLNDPSIEHLETNIDSNWQRYWKYSSQKKKLRQVLLDLIPRYEDSYWNYHYTFETTTKSQFLPLIGEDLQQEILINVILPLLYDRIKSRGNVSEIQYFREFFATLPAGKTSKTRYLIHRFYGDAPKGKILMKGDTEQGAYQLHRDFCVHYEASCEGCPFVETYKRQLLSLDHTDVVFLTPLR